MMDRGLSLRNAPPQGASIPSLSLGSVRWTKGCSVL
jgi:hypothetical protein